MFFSLFPLVTHLCVFVVAVVSFKIKFRGEKKGPNDEDCCLIDVEINVKSIFFFCSSNECERQKEGETKKKADVIGWKSTVAVHTQIPHKQIRSVYGFILHILHFFNHKGEKFFFINSYIE